MAEVIAIVACVAAVVSAYRDGTVIVRRIKEKRRARKALPPTILLEESLEKGSREVEEAKENGVKRFGPEFAIGDQIATDALKDVIIELQGSLIKHLRQAAEDDGMIDFTILVDASDEGRIKALSVLNDLYLRTAIKSRAGDSSEINTPPTGSELITLPNPPSQSPPVYRPIEGHDNSTSPTKYKLGGMFSRKPTFAIVDSHRDMPPSNSGPNIIRSSATTTLPKEPTSEYNPWETESSRSPNEPQGSSPRGRQESPTETLISLGRKPTNISKPSSKDAYGGFCKGAYKLQVGLKDGLKLRNQSGTMLGEGYYWACGSSKCAFDGPACKKDKDWVHDDTVHSCYGIRYRWIFLAKSHIVMSKVKNHIYDYRCVFCVSEDYESPIFRDVKGLMEHVSKHRGQQLGDGVLRKLNCINKRVATEQEDFDINLMPDDSKFDPGEPTDIDRMPTDDDSTTWSTSEGTTLVTNHWRDLT